MSEHHGAATIKEWMEDLVRAARSGREFNMSAGAEPGRRYSYLQFHVPDEDHSILLFTVDDAGEDPEVRAFRFQGSAEEVREKVDALTHDRD